MKITFCIGNGFDLNLNLKTGYKSFYPYFVEHASPNNQIVKWLKEDNLNWADLEEKLGKRLENVTEDTVERFYEEKAELENCLLDYLEKEQSKLNVSQFEDEISEEIVRSLLTYYSDLAEVEKEKLMIIYNRYKEQEYVYNFLNFNYTYVLDQLVEVARKLRNPIGKHNSSYGDKENILGEVLHVHGNLNEDMILGVNDEEQIHNNFLKTNSDFLDVFIKQRINENIGQKKTEYGRKMLRESQIICIFGMSLGITDKMWWEEIMLWLKASEEHVLLLCYKGYEKTLRRKIPSQTIPLKNKLKREFLKKCGFNEENEEILELKKRIFILYNPNIFNFKEIGCVFEDN